MTWLSSKPLVTKKKGGGGLTVRTLVIDATSNWGNGVFIGFKELDLMLGGSKIAYPSSTPVVAGGAPSANSNFLNKFAFSTDLSLTGTFFGTSWAMTGGATESFRVWVQYPEIRIFDALLFNNMMHLGGSTDMGMKDAAIHITNQLFASDDVEEAVPGGTTIFAGVLPEHAATDTEQNYLIPLI